MLFPGLMNGMMLSRDGQRMLHLQAERCFVPGGSLPLQCVNYLNAVRTLCAESGQ